MTTISLQGDLKQKKKAQAGPGSLVVSHIVTSGSTPSLFSVKKMLGRDLCLHASTCITKKKLNCSLDIHFIFDFFSKDIVLHEFLTPSKHLKQTLSVSFSPGAYFGLLGGRETMPLSSLLSSYNKSMLLYILLML